MQQSHNRQRLGRWPQREWRVRRSVGGPLAALGLFTALVVSLPGPVLAQDGGLKIELNKVEDVDAGCMASFVFQNNFDVTLDRFNLDLFLFDPEGVIVRRVMIDLAPLPNGKTRVAQFHLLAEGCGQLSRVLVNDIPQCRVETGEPVDCLAGLAVSSRSTIELAK